MKKYLSGLCLLGIFLSSTLVMPVAYTQDTQQHRHHKGNKADTMSDTRMKRNNEPVMKKTDSLPAPSPPSPRNMSFPDSIPTKR